MSAGDFHVLREPPGNTKGEILDGIANQHQSVAHSGDPRLHRHALPDWQTKFLATQGLILFVPDALPERVDVPPHFDYPADQLVS
jgi:hypothetical protein